MDVKKSCANATRAGCEGIVVQKGNILCDLCIESRKAQLKLRKEQNMEDLFERNKDMENQLYRLKQEHADTVSKYEDTIRNLIDEKSEVEQKKLDQYKQDALRLEEEFSKKLKQHELNNQVLVVKQQELEKENTTLGEKIKELNNIILEKNVRLQQIQLELSDLNISLKNENNRLTTLHDRYKEYNARLERENASLSEENRKLQIQNEMLVQEKERLLLEVSHIKLEGDQILLDNKRLTEINSQLINQNELLTKENEVLTHTNEQLLHSQHSQEEPPPLERIPSSERSKPPLERIPSKTNPPLERVSSKPVRQTMDTPHSTSHGHHHKKIDPLRKKS